MCADISQWFKGCWLIRWWLLIDLDAVASPAPKKSHTRPEHPAPSALAPASNSACTAATWPWRAAQWRAWRPSPSVQWRSAPWVRFGSWAVIGAVGRAKKTAHKPTKESQYQPRSTRMHLFFLQAVRSIHVYTVYTTTNMDRLKEKDSLCVIKMFCFTAWSGKPTLDRRISVYMIIMFYIVYNTSSNFFKGSFRCSISLIKDSYNIPYVH